MIVVDDLQKHFHITGQPIKVATRSVLEAIARFNLKGQPATNTDIYHYLDKGMDIGYIRKITGQRLKYKNNEGNIVNLVIALEDKRGHGDQFVLANMQHTVTTTNKEEDKTAAAAPTYTLSSLPNTFTPPLPEHILNVFYPLWWSHAHSPPSSIIHENPLYYIREIIAYPQPTHDEHYIYSAR